MARDFNGTSNQITHNGPAFGSAGTISFVVKKNVADSETGWRYVFDSTTRHLFYKRGGSAEGANTYGVYLNGNLIWDDATSVANVMTGLDWQVVTITWDDSDPTTKERIYRNGVQLATANVTVGAGTPATIYMGTRFTSVEYWSGSFAEYAVWNRKLSASEVTVLGNFYTPKTIPRGLIFYAPYYGKNSPEPEIVSGKNGTITGATATAHPRVFHPSPPQNFSVTAAVAAVTAKRLTLLGVG
jgi:hypothetical protein